MIHIGGKIKEVLNDSNLAVQEFALRINKSRTVIYNIFERETIDSGLLLKICRVLDHDFFSYYVAQNGSFNDPQGIYQTTKKTSLELENYKKELAQAKKEIEYLKKINELQEHKINSLSKKSDI